MPDTFHVSSKRKRSRLRKNQTRQEKMFIIAKALLDDYSDRKMSGKSPTNWSQRKLAHIKGLLTQKEDTFRQTIIDPWVNAKILEEHPYKPLYFSQDAPPLSVYTLTEYGKKELEEWRLQIQKKPWML